MFPEEWLQDFSREWLQAFSRKSRSQKIPSFYLFSKIRFLLQRQLFGWFATNKTSQDTNDQTYFQNTFVMCVLSERHSESMFASLCCNALITETRAYKGTSPQKRSDSYEYPMNQILYQSNATKPKVDLLTKAVWIDSCGASRLQTQDEIFFSLLLTTDLGGKCSKLWIHQLETCSVCAGVLRRTFH